MHAAEQQDLLDLLKVLGQPQRLTMIQLMSQREYTVGEMAGILELTEPTVSHHVSKLHGAGLLRLRMAGNQRFYRLNEGRLERFKAYVAEIEQPLAERPVEESDDRWIEALKLSAADKKVLRDYTVNGRLKQLPTKMKKWLAVLRWLATRFEPDTRYTEPEVNAILTEVHPDYATLRRYLVEQGFMRRERGGGKYWLAPEEE
jgi:hypothetical protein